MDNNQNIPPQGNPLPNVNQPNNLPSQNIPQQQPQPQPGIPSTPNQDVPVSNEKKDNKTVLILVILLALILTGTTIFILLINFSQNQVESDKTNDAMKELKRNKPEGMEWEECERKIENLKAYIESKNHCEHVNECKIINIPQCNFGLTGLDVDTEYVGKVYSEFYSSDGNCYTGWIHECPNPKEGKTIVCENNKCLFKDL